MSGRRLEPVTPATREAAEWWLGEMRSGLTADTPAPEVDAHVRAHAKRVSHVVLVLAATLAGAPRDLLASGGPPPAGRLVANLVRVEVARLARLP